MTHPTVAQVHQLVRAEAEAWRAGDVDAVASAFAPDARFVAPGGVWVGAEGVRTAMREFLATAEVVDIEIGQILCEGNVACIEWRWTERRHADGSVHTMEDAIVVEFDGDQVTRWREYFDPGQSVPLEGG